MADKKIAILLTFIIIAASLFAGCINSNDNDDDETQYIVVTVTEVLTLNESKIISVEDTDYNLTVKKIENQTVILAINSEDTLIMANIGELVELDSDLDGTNDIELNVSKIEGLEVTIELKLTTSTSKYNYIEDDMGEKVRVPKKLDKIISMAPSITEIIFSLGVGDKIVGKDSASDYPKECKGIDVVSTYEGVDLEKILAKDPDIIILDKSLDFYDTNYNKLKDYGLCVFRLYPRTLQDVLDNIELLGEVTASATTAQEVIAGLETRIDTIKTRETLKPKVLYVIYYDGISSPWVGTSSTFNGDLIATAGGKVAIEDDQGKAIEITVEHLIDLNPDIIFTSQDDNWPTPSRDSILNDDALQDLTAVKNDRVIDVNADLIDRPGPRLVDGLELFSDYITA
ncbi:MAG: ABC transporter substrate-binding protein [Thermoplasmata archaeon]|nr:ABC transporter substrate-binding protein [Thermoplasmata archaeon]